MTRALTIVVGLALVVYAGLCAALYLFQRSLLYDPQPRAIAADASTLRLPVDGAEIVVTVRPLDGPRAIVYFGGNAEDVSLNLPSFTQAFPDRALYLMHYRGYGGSTGRPTETANVADGVALVERVRATHPDIAVIGRSLGSGVAAQVARRVAVSRLVLVTPFDSIVGIAARMYRFMPVRWLAQDRYESGRFAPGIAVPTTLVAAANDRLIPRASTEQLYARFAAGVATMTVIEGVGHNDIDRNPAYLETLRAALR